MSSRASSRPLLPRSLTFAVLLSALLALALTRWRAPHRPVARPHAMSGAWMRPQGPDAPTGMFRRRFNVGGNVRRAWISVAAHEGFELSVNGSPIGRSRLWRPTRPYQNGTSERGQRLAPSRPSIALNFPREYQWTGHDSALVPIFFDLTPFLEAGENVVCLQVEARSAPAAVRCDGEVVLRSGERVSLDSGDPWLAEAVAPDGRPLDWRDRNYRDLAWRAAARASGLREEHVRVLDPAAFAEDFRGRWLAAGAVLAGPVAFETEWELDDEPEEAWLRVLANRSFELLVEDELVRVADAQGHADDAGDWPLDARVRIDPVRTPDLLDPDEIGSLFGGDAFETLRYGSDDRELERFDRYGDRELRRTGAGGQPLTRTALSESLRASELDDYPFTPGARAPTSLGRERGSEAFFAYDVRWMLGRGTNRLAVHVFPPMSDDEATWPARIAVDGRARFADGREAELASDGTWRVVRLAAAAPPGAVAARAQRAQRVDVGGPASVSGQRLPRLVWRGSAAHSRGRLAAYLDSLSFACTAVACLGFLLLVGSALREGREGARATLLALPGTLLLPLAFLGAVFASEVAHGELHERVFYLRPGTWAWVLLAAGGLALLGLVRVAGLGSLPYPRLRQSRWTLRRLPATPLWPLLIAAVAVGAFALRAFDLHLQPLDDDEYASTQAILEIARSGLPHYVPEGILYTRGPLYHYITAASVWLFGPNLWALRLPSAVFGVATCLLAYRCGEKLLRSPWIGLGAAFLLAIHPYQVFTGHVARFYQQQQFFVLLTAYCFCRGYVLGSAPRYRMATVVAALCATLSQEISALLFVPLGLGWYFFGRRRDLASELRLGVLTGCAVIWIALDYAAFQVLCLTRTEGISPIVQARVEPNFGAPYNFAALLLGYSRLHVVLSTFLVVGLVRAVRSRDRSVLALAFLLLGGVALVNVLVTHVSLRYQYAFFPLWVLLGVYGIAAAARGLAGLSLPPGPLRRVNRWMPSACAFLFLATVVVSWAPWRIRDSYASTLLGDATGAFRFVASQWRTGDRIAATEPHTHAALLEVGQVDYDLAVPLLYDFAVRERGRLVDRNAGARVLASLADLEDVVRRNDRLWIVLNREKLRSRGRNLRWEYPGARIESFIRQNCRLEYESYLWSVFLWDASSGRYRGFRRAGV